MTKSTISLITGGCCLVLAAAPISIGTVRSAGEFRVDGSAIKGNSTLFEGNLVETEGARSVLQVGEARVTLLPESRAKIYRDRTVLEKGSSLFAGDPRHRLEAANLQIIPGAKDSLLQVEVAGPKYVSIAARGGTAEVLNSSGILVASLSTGMALAFDPQAAAYTAVRMTGTVTTSGGKYYLTDARTNIKVELRGPDLAKYVGKEIEITGSVIPDATPTGGASETVQVVSSNPVGKAGGNGNGSSGSSGSAGAGAGAGGAAAGHSGLLTAVIIGGVAVTGTAVGLAAAGKFSSSAPVSHQ